MDRQQSSPLVRFLAALLLSTSTLPPLSHANPSEQASSHDNPSSPPRKICSSVYPPLRAPWSSSSSSSAVCPAPLDHDSPFQTPLDWSPWTHKPSCIRFGTKKPSEKFCAYTNSRHGIGGFSMVTTPERAAMSLPVLDEPLVPSHYDDGGDSKPYEIVSIPGKGMGVIATRHIAQHERVMVDYAALAVDMDVATKVGRASGYHLLHEATDRLADPGRVLGLGRSTKMAQDVVEDVLRTNAFHSPMAGEPHMALYPEIARMNHACDPNAFPQFRPGSLRVTVAASRPIEPGEEITISYITLGQTRAQRHAALSRWEFTCTCALCTAPADETSASDARRMKISVLQDEFRAAFNRRDGKGAIGAANAVLQLLHRERIFSAYAEPHENLARVYWAMGDREGAVAEAKRSLDVLVEWGYLERAGEAEVEMLLGSFG